MCHLFIGQKFRQKITPTSALYPSSKNTDSRGAILPSLNLLIRDTSSLEASRHTSRLWHQGYLQGDWRIFFWGAGGHNYLSPLRMCEHFSFCFCLYFEPQETPVFFYQILANEWMYSFDVFWSFIFKYYRSVMSLAHVVQRAQKYIGILCVLIYTLYIQCIKVIHTIHIPNT